MIKAPYLQSTMRATASRLLSMAVAVAALAGVSAGPVGYLPDRLLVKAKGHLSEGQIQAEVAQQGAVQIGAIPQAGIRVLQIHPSQHSQVLDALRHNPNIEFAEPDYIIAPDAAPNDPYFTSQWHLTKIAASTAWDTTTGSSSVIVAILDTGVDGTHPDLVANLIPGWNIYDNNSDTSDVYGHGTATAGTAAAAGNNGIGVAAVALNCPIMPVRISDLNGYGYSSTISSGLTWAADHGARVANISYEVSGISAVASAAQYFQSKGGVVTVSSGNSGTVLSTADNPYVLTVSATDANDAIASWSNTGNLIDLAAPGVNVFTTSRGGGYGYWSGTSFSAPIVAGVAALVISANPNLSGAQVQDVLKQSADDLGTAGWDTRYGWGRVNAAAAVNLALNTSQIRETTPPTVNITSPANGSLVSRSITVQVSASDNVGVASVTLSVDGVAIGTLTSAPYNFAWDTTGVSDGTHRLEAVARDTAGNSSSSSLNVTVGNAPDTVAPSISIVSPANGARVKNNVSVQVSASDNRGVTKVELYVDDQLTSSSTIAPFTTNWNVRKAASGAYTLRCVAYDAAGNTGWAAITAYK